MAERARIQKAIAHAGLMSRRKAEEAVAAGRVRLDGRPAVLGDRVDVDAQTLTLDGVPLPLNPGLETHLLYKPVGVISSAADPGSRPTVVDLIDSDKRLYPVGRLDADSEGLILVSNDGELANRVAHPRHGITRTYLARVGGRPSARGLRALTEGVELEDGPARASAARLVAAHDDRSLVELVMVEGRNRQVRRMMAAIGHEVGALVRTAIGPLTDRRLRAGESRVLAPSDVRRLMEAGGRR